MKPNRTEGFVFAMIILLFWIYLFFRAILIQPMHDEIATFYYFVQPGQFIPYHSDWTTNNHILNSALTFVSFHLFGSSPLALRLPNLLFFPLFGFFIWKISAFLRSPLMRWGFLICLLFIHNYIEFFAMSRGYGLALTMLVGSIWFTMRVFVAPDVKNQILAIAFGVLSVSAILININSLIVVMSLLLLKSVSDKNPRTILSTIAVMILGIIPMLAAVWYLFDLNTAGRLDYGGTEGFWTTSVKDLTNMLFGKWSFLADAYLILMLLLIAIAVVMILYRNATLQKNLRLLLSPQWVFFFLLTGNLIGFFLEHHLFGVLYPGNRTSMQLIILFIGTLFFIFDSVDIQFRRVFILTLLPLILLPVYFLWSINFRKISVENEDIPKRFSEIILNHKKTTGDSPTIQGYKGRELRWAYLNYQMKQNLPMVHNSTWPDSIADFQIVDPEKFPFTDHYLTVDSAPGSGLQILERKIKLHRELVYKSSPEFAREFTNDEFILLARGETDTLKAENLLAQYELNIQSEKRFPVVWVVFAVQNEEGKEMVYERVPLNWYNYDWISGTEKFETSILAAGIHASTLRWVTYIWNVNKVPLKVNTTQLSIFILKNQ